jgi:phage baseplate assembly protein W
MAFGAQKIFPIDTKPGTAVGVAIPFDAPGVFYSTYTTQAAVKNNLLNFFLTNPTERYLVPSFGAGLRTFIFEQITTGNLDSLKERIQFQLNQYFPSVIVSRLEILQNPEYNSITIILKYTIQDTVISDEIQITFD